MRKTKRERKEKARNSEKREWGNNKNIRKGHKRRWKERREEGRLLWAQVSTDTRKSENT